MSASDIEHLNKLTISLSELAEHIDDGEFLAHVAVRANALPHDLRLFMEDFRVSGRSPACLVRGYPIDEARIGPSPTVCNRRRFGSPADPYLRFDQDYVDWPDDVDGISEAVEALRRVIDESLIHLPLRSGDFLVLDNRRAVHGRSSFTPTYRGTDRWLKRLNITRNLERSRHLRRSALDRVIYV
ncbi:TauD/TfdA family dioxygenase [Nocardia sp. NBC_01730]|uniref:TauD/TfdA family dioxygenase n=1 Tax=Nocardia sp. NBC_01730 TaxID=2975998 RepID=UPI002E13D30E|nr:TauD/TfdA family dioxygenase [Nocardia sp. NBC_01730]